MGGTVDSDSFATWEKVVGKDKALPPPSNAPSTPGPKASGAGRSQGGTSTPRSGMAARHSVSAGSGSSSAAPPLSPTPSATRVASPTPTLTQIDSLMSELGSRSGSPLTLMSEDEREDFLRRENELNDMLTDKDHELQASLKECESMRDELSYMKTESANTGKRNEELSSEAAQLKLELEKVSFGHKEAEITIESLTEANSEMTSQLSKLKDEVDELKRQAGDEAANAIDKEKVRAARVAAMLNDMDSAKAISRHEAGMGDLLRSLVEAGDDDSKKVELLTQMRKEIDESRDIIQEKEGIIEELTLKNQDLSVQCEDIDSKYERLLTEYEDMIEQSIAAEELQDSRDIETINELKLKLEAHYNNKINSQKAQLEATQADLQRRHDELAKCNATMRELRSESRELQAKIEALTEEKNKSDAAAAAAASASGSGAIGADAAAATEHAMVKEREMHMMRREMAQRILEYDTMRKSLMRDVQNRCEKIIELEMALDEAREQVSQLTRRVGGSAQPQRMQLLEKNVAQLTLMQKELVMQNTDMKKQVALSDRKLYARTERIKYLEDRLKEADAKAESWRLKAEELQNERNREMSRSTKQPSANNILRFSRIAKPMRGGGGQANAADEKAAASATTGRTSGGFFSWGSN
ncbi:hypothetical protein GGI12_001406 [Dipsacomyces acuminosporus]|nr:hypothetical protein GGI12_001406 [Dipsacomyces acuminosporus]